MTTNPFSFGVSVEVDNRTGRILAAYCRVRKGKSSETREFDRGKVFVDYNSRGEILGVEVLARTTSAVLDRVTSNEPQSREFVRRSVPCELAIA
jgi:uncharacterized protein YuzE